MPKKRIKTEANVLWFLKFVCGDCGQDSKRAPEVEPSIFDLQNGERLLELYLREKYALLRVISRDSSILCCKPVSYLKLS